MIRLSHHAFGEVKSLIKSYAGINLDLIQEKGLIEKINRNLATRGFTNFDEYYALLTSPQGEQERDELISLVTVNETYFFRHPAQFRHLLEETLPNLASQRSQGSVPARLRAWSAACSTGEEPCSMAFMVEQFKRRRPEIGISIVASDINRTSLDKAKSGLFRQRSSRTQTDEILQQFSETPFITARNDGWQVDPAILAHIQWKRLNLRDFSALQSLRGLDIIFCRNVLIYFDEPFRLELLAVFHQLLNDGGVMYLGESEALPMRQELFQPCRSMNTYVYTKRATANGGATTPPPRRQNP